MIVTVISLVLTAVGLLFTGIAIWVTVGGPGINTTAGNGEHFAFGLLLLVIALPALISGPLLFFLFSHDAKEKIVENANNPLICECCKRDYDRTWKVCLTCGQPLVEKSRKGLVRDGSESATREI